MLDVNLMENAGLAMVDGYSHTRVVFYADRHHQNLIDPCDLPAPLLSPALPITINFHTRVHDK